MIVTSSSLRSAPWSAWTRPVLSNQLYPDLPLVLPQAHGTAYISTEPAPYLCRRCWTWTAGPQERPQRGRPVNVNHTTPVADIDFIFYFSFAEFVWSSA